MDDLQPLIEARSLLARELDLHRLKGISLQKKYEGAVLALQAACTHTDLDEEWKYYSGGYDYCAETFYKTTCRTCSKVIKQWSKTHHGIYG